MDTRKRMQFSRVDEAADAITVETTGARYVFRKSGPKGPGGPGRIECTQLINGVRQVAQIDCSIPFEHLTLENPHVAEADADLHAPCVLNTIPVESSCQFLRIEIHPDSLLQVYATSPMVLTVSSDLDAQYQADTQGHLLLVDDTGGIGVYPCGSLQDRDLTHTPGEAPKWDVRYHFGRNGRLLFSVFPPRAFDFDQYYGEGIIHHGTIQPWVVPPFPTDEMIQKASEHTRVLVLHEGLWAGKLTREGKPVETVKDLYAEGAYVSHDFEAFDEKELVRTIQTSHRLGMKVIPYMSPFYSSARGWVYWRNVEKRLQQYEMDGLYFDGISQDILESYDTIRMARNVVGDGSLYVHCTSDPVSKNVFCPFIDTHADYILRAEHATALNDSYLRYVISGYNVSNSIGHLCYYDFPADTLRATIEKALEYRFRFYLGSPETELERVLQEDYFPRLAEEGSSRAGA